jgi:hypothetical protein
MARTVLEARFVVEVTQEVWDKLDDKALTDICEQVDALVSFAHSHLADQLRTVAGKPTVRRED